MCVCMWQTVSVSVLVFAKFVSRMLVQAVIDQDALAERKFRLCQFGVLRRVLGTQDGIHRNNLGESSRSVRARVLSMSRVQVGDVTQNEPFVAAKVAAAPLEYLDYLPKGSHNISTLAATYYQCEQLRLALGEDALKGTSFEGLSDLPDEKPSAKNPSDPTAVEATDMTPEQLREMVQRRVAEAAKDALPRTSVSTSILTTFITSIHVYLYATCRCTV